MNKEDKRKEKKIEALMRKVERLYTNYGINTTDMTEEEIRRICELYIDNGGDIDSDIKNSEKYKERFKEDII